MDAIEDEKSLDHEPIPSPTTRAGSALGHDEAEADEAGDPSDPRPGRRPTITPAEAHERLARGEVVEKVRVVGLVLKKAHAHPIRFRDALLVNLAIDRAEFAEEVRFERCTLHRPRFGKATFSKGLDLRGSLLVRPVFRGLVVKGTTRLDRAEFRGQAEMIDCAFEGKVRAWEARFGGWMKFERCTFADEADFRSVHSDEGFVLDHCVFSGAALFRGATCCKKWDAIGSTFLGLLDLSRAKLHDFVYLEAIVQGEAQRFAFHNALAERLLIRTEQLVGRIESEQALDHARAMEEYGLLKRGFEGLHRYDQEDWAFYRFKVNQRRRHPRSWSRPWTKLTQAIDWLLLDVGCGYGTNPLRAVRAALVLILGFGLIYALGVESLPADRLPFDGPVTAPANRLMVALLTSVTVFTSGFGGLKDAARGWMNVPLLLESLLGTFLWGLFIVAFSRKVIR